MMQKKREDAKNIKKLDEKSVERVVSLLRDEVKSFPNPIITNIKEVSDTPFKVLISCILSLRTLDTTTGPVAKALFREVQTPKELAAMPLAQLERIIRPVNYYRTKARNIVEMSRRIATEFKGKVPDTFEGLMQLKGVGKKTAAITMLFGHKKKDFIAVDVHVHVISNRLGWVKTKNAEETMDSLMKVLPKKYWRDINELMVLHGQNVCFTNSPICSTCALVKRCPKVGVTRSR